MAYDDRSIYARLDLCDTDVFTAATADGDSLFTLGDVAEWFIGPPPAADAGDNNQDEGWYLELHVAPNGLRTAYLFTGPGRGNLLPVIPFSAEVAVDDTLDNASDGDRGWSTMFTLPWKALEAVDPTVGRDTPLTMLLGRYNYNREMPDGDGDVGSPELTMWPVQSQRNFHLRQHHAPIWFEP